MRRIVIILLFLLPIVSCQKDERALFDGKSCNGSCSILTGRLSEGQSSKPLINTELKFYYRPAGFSLLDQTKYLGKSVTASDGSYSFDFDSNDFENLPDRFG